MPRYFFDTDDGSRFVTDDVGVDLDSQEAAQKAAVAALPEMADDVLPDGSHRVLTVMVRDDSGTAIIRATLTLRVETLG